MSGSFPDTSAAANAEAEAQVVAGIAAVLAQVADAQAEAARFISMHGEAVVDGHGYLSGPAGTTLDL